MSHQYCNTCTCTTTRPVLTHLYTVTRNIVIYRSGCRRRQASGLWSVVAPAVRQQRPPKWPRDPHALRRPAPGLRPLASAAFGHGDRPGILRVQGGLVIHVVLHNNTGGTGTAVLQCTLQYFCSTGQYRRLVLARFDRPGDLVKKTKM